MFGPLAPSPAPRNLLRILLAAPNFPSSLGRVERRPLDHEVLDREVLRRLGRDLLLRLDQQRGHEELRRHLGHEVLRYLGLEVLGRLHQERVDKVDSGAIPAQ